MIEFKERTDRRNSWNIVLIELVEPSLERAIQVGKEERCVRLTQRDID